MPRRLADGVSAKVDERRALEEAILGYARIDLDLSL